MAKLVRLSNRQLAKITGGDYGDSDSEVSNYNQVNFMYNIGDEVEVYVFKWHFWGTKHAVIIDRYPYLDPYDGWRAYYTVRYDDGKEYNCVLSDDIENNKKK